MRLLLDTHIFLWMHTAPGRLGTYREIIEDLDTELLVSAASAWEIAIKYSLAKLSLPEPPDRYVPNRIRQTKSTAISIEHNHALAVADLPPIHRDPFDRLLLAQAQELRVPLLTADATVAGYPVETMLVG